MSDARYRHALRAIVAVTEGDLSTAALFAHDLAKQGLAAYDPPREVPPTELQASAHRAGRREALDQVTALLASGRFRDAATPETVRIFMTLLDAVDDLKRLP